MNHREQSVGYEQEDYQIVYKNRINRYRCDLEGRHDGIKYNNLCTWVSFCEEKTHRKSTEQHDTNQY